MISVKNLRRWTSLAPSRKIQWLQLAASRLITRLFHSFRLKSCGRGVMVRRPLFWTPEYIEISSNVLIWPGCRLEGVDEYSGTTFTPRIDIRDGVTLQQNCHITAASHLVIGRDTNVLCGVVITDIDHGFDLLNVNYAFQPIRVSRTQIGRNCFIGAGAKILAGTVLGDNCIVGANAVVRGQFDEGSVIVGCPGRVIRRVA